MRIGKSFASDFTIENITITALLAKAAVQLQAIWWLQSQRR